MKSWLMEKKVRKNIPLLISTIIVLIALVFVSYPIIFNGDNINILVGWMLSIGFIGCFAVIVCFQLKKAKIRITKAMEITFALFAIVCGMIIPSCVALAGMEKQEHNNSLVQDKIVYSNKIQAIYYMPNEIIDYATQKIQEGEDVKVEMIDKNRDPYIHVVSYTKSNITTGEEESGIEYRIYWPNNPDMPFDLSLAKPQEITQK